jgi:DNA (cytosine-5)-methyltransferase 1
MSAYYNENDPIAAEWLRRLIAAGLIAPGFVDERSILEVRPEDLRGFRQCHFFAGIGVWSHALRLAGWADDRPIWTGSCPCQPFSSAGKRAGHEDERHLWPAWFGLIGESHPVAVVGEQVADGDGKAWLDLVASDLEGRGYAVGAVSTLAAGFGSPNLRQRLYFVAHSDVVADGRLHQGRPNGPRASEHPRVGGLADSSGDRAREFTRILQGDEGEHGERPARDDHASVAGRTVGELADPSDTDRRPGERRAKEGTRPDGQRRRGPSGGGATRELVDAELARLEGHRRDGDRGDEPGRDKAGAAGSVAAASGPCDVALEDSNGRGRGPLGPSVTGQEGWATQPHDRIEPRSMADAQRGGREQHEGTRAGPGAPESGRATGGPEGRGDPGPVNGFWSDAEWLPCTDGKARPIEPGTFPLAHGAPARVGRLRAYGNALNAYQAAHFLAAYRELIDGD